MMDNVILITGASSGLGQSAARRLAKAGATVYGTSRRDLPDTPEGVRMRQLDVTVDESVQACVQGVLEEAGRIDVLVNNAGMLHYGLAEETTPEGARGVFETNFWGQVRMTNAVLPGMRERGAGRIVFMGSLAGLISGPGMGFYSATKHALEAYVEALYYEVARLGVDIIMLEPGFFATSEAHGFASDDEAIPAYDGIRQQAKRKIDGQLTGGGDPEKVAALIERVVRARAPRLRYRAGPDAHVLPLVRLATPHPLYAWGVRHWYGLPATP